MPLDDDEHRDEVLEIKDRIVEEHHRGGHVTGPVAGCAICAQLTTASSFTSTPTPTPAPPTSIEELARLRLAAGMQAPDADEYEDELELARADAAQALTDAAMGKHGLAAVTATVGVIRALAAINETLSAILAAVTGPDPAPVPGPVEDDDPEGLYDGSAEAAANRGVGGYPKGTIGGDVDDA
jgi:hypothetical protein